MLPFDRYPSGGNVLLGRLRGANARHEYGLALQRLSGQHQCTYCGLEFLDDYYHWLLLSVDHVVPAGEARRLGIPDSYYEDMINLVLSCSACNHFDNGFKVPRQPQTEWTLEEFVTVRDTVFAERRPRIEACHAREKAFFDGRPWQEV